MGGDLNLKKSWHPNLLKNQRKVYDEEKKALEERKQIDKLVRERQEERHLEELQKLQENAGGARRLNRVEWMYTGAPSGDGPGNRPAEEMEGFLLGKRRIDTLLKSEDKKAVEPRNTTNANEEVPALVNTRDLAAKIRDDPLLAIMKQQQAAMESLASKEVRKRPSRQAGNEEDRYQGKGKRRHSDEERRRARSRSRSPRRHKRRTTDHDRDRRRPRSPYGEERRTSRSPRREKRRRSRSPRSRTPPRREERRRSRSPRRDERLCDNRRSRSPQQHHDRFDRRRNDNYRNDFRRDYQPRNRETNREPRENANKEEERAKKLAAMQAQASNLEEDRKRRVEEIKQKEEQERMEDDKRRSEKGRFVAGLHKQAENVDLGQRLQRTRGTLEKLEAY